MNISIFVYGYLPWDVYGIPRHIERLSQWLSDQGHKVWIVTRGNLQLKKIEKVNENITIYRTFHPNLKDLKSSFLKNRLALFKRLLNTYFYLFMTIIEGCRLIKKNKIQILHGHHLEYGGLQAIMLGKLLKRPIVLTIHGSGLDYYSGYQKLPSKLRFLKHSNLKIICQKRSAIKILKNWSFSESKIEYLKNFVDSKRFNPSKKVAHKKSKNIVFVGRLVRFKGPNLLLNAIPPIINQFPNAKFLFAGEGEMLDSLKQRSIELGVQNHVTFLGMVKNIEEVYSKADIFVSLSYHENFTDLALLEAMSFGIPVIATNVGETKRIIKHKLTGLLVSCDPKEIAEKINFLLKNPNISEKLGNNGRKIIIDQYSTEKFCKIHELIYRNMIKNFIKSNSN